MRSNWRLLAENLPKENLDHLLVETEPNRHYLTGFTGSAGYALISAKGIPALIVDSRYTLQAKKQAKDFKIIEAGNFIKDFFLPFVKKNAGTRLGFETNISHEKLMSLKKSSKGIKLVPVKNLVEKLRSVKSDSEIKLIKKALKISDYAFNNIISAIKPGVTESEIAWKLEVFMREGGASKSAWDPQIVASGVNSALPHHGHSNKKIKKGEIVQLDFGGVLKGYHTDTSRVIFVGQPNQKQKELYDLVLRAQMLGISLIKPGIAAKDIDTQVRKFLGSKLDGIYGHGLGHGVGLQIHEIPNISLTSKDILQAGQVITIEPGVYIENWGGIRLEDMVLVTGTGYEVLTKAAKDLNAITSK